LIFLMPLARIVMRDWRLLPLVDKNLNACDARSKERDVCLARWRMEKWRKMPPTAIECFILNLV
jgi:hypothetical protein